VQRIPFENLTRKVEVENSFLIGANGMAVLSESNEIVKNDHSTTQEMKILGREWFSSLVIGSVTP
jgi:hypothetical protein